MAYQYYLALLNGEDGEGVLAQLPETHPRAAIWKARQAVVDDPEKAAALIARLAKGGDRDMLRILAEARYRQGDAAAALQAWFQAKDDRSLVAAEAELRAEDELELALLARQLAYDIYPMKQTTYLASFLRDQLQDYPPAVEIWEKALVAYKYSRQRASWYAQLGRTHRAAEDWQAAIAVYQRAIAENLGNIEAMIELGWTYHQRGDGFEATLITFRQAIETDPNSGKGYYASGELYASQGDYAEADRWYQAALEREPVNRTYLLRRGSMAVRGEDYPLARQAYEDLTTAHPEYAPGYYELAKIYQLLDQPALAVENIERFLDLKEEPTEREYSIVTEIYEWAGRGGE